MEVERTLVGPCSEDLPAHSDWPGAGLLCGHEFPELSHNQARSVEVAAHAFKYQASGANYNTKVAAFSLGPKPQKILSKSLKVTGSSGAAV